MCREGEFLVMDFPAFHGRKIPVTELMTKVMGTAPREALLDEDLLLVYENEEIIRKMTPEFVLMKQLDGLGVAVSAPGREFDCVSRYFAPKLKVNEDPVTGAAHCLLVPYWAERFGKKPSPSMAGVRARRRASLRSVRKPRHPCRESRSLFNF